MGGGGGSQYYQGLEDLYNQQVASSKQLQGESGKTFADLGQLRQQAADYGSIANKNKVAGQAEADYQTQFNAGINNLDKNLASYGIDPSNPASIRAKSEMANNAFATGAGGITAGRNQMSDKAYAMNSDIVSMGLGLPGQATSAANSAGNAMSQAGSLNNQANATSAQNWGSLTGAGIALSGTGAGNAVKNWASTIFSADGGVVRRFEGGGFVSPFANGGMAQAPTGYAMGGQTKGIVGAMNNIQPPAQPASAGPSEGQALLTNGIQGYALASKLAKTQVDKALAGMNGNAALDAGMGDYGTIGNFGVPAAAAAPAAEEASAAVAPELLDLAMFAANGGSIHPMSNHPKNGIPGGPVHGPGGPKDDLIPAMLSNGEFIMPVGTVKKYGLDKLEKMRQEGLEFEKHLGIRSHA
jgi:hypothetical protein